MLHWELNLKAVSFLSLDCLMAVNTYCFCVLSVEYQQNFLFYLACTDMKSNGLALRFHRSQLVRNELLHLRHRHVCGGSLKYPESQIFSSLWLNLCSCQLLGCDPQHWEDGGKVLVPDLVKHLVFAGELELGWGFSFRHFGREFHGAARYAESLVQEALVGKRREEAWSPERKVNQKKVGRIYQSRSRSRMMRWPISGLCALGFPSSWLYRASSLRSFLTLLPWPNTLGIIPKRDCNPQRALERKRQLWWKPFWRNIPGYRWKEGRIPCQIVGPEKLERIMENGSYNWSL